MGEEKVNLCKFLITYLSAASLRRRRRRDRLLGETRSFVPPFLRWPKTTVLGTLTDGSRHSTQDGVVSNVSFACWTLRLCRPSAGKCMAPSSSPDPIFDVFLLFLLLLPSPPFISFRDGNPSPSFPVPTVWAGPRPEGRNGTIKTRVVGRRLLLGSVK